MSCAAGIGIVWVDAEECGSGWGNGNVEVFMEKHDDLPCMMSPARQSLEKQLGDENAES
jgi:predicted transport protein